MGFARQNCHYCHGSTTSNGRPVASGWADCNESEKDKAPSSPSENGDRESAIPNNNNINTETQNQSSNFDSNHHRRRRRRWNNWNRSIKPLLTILLIIGVQQRSTHGAPVACGSNCRRGACRGAVQSNNDTASQLYGSVDYSTNDIIDSVVDNDTTQPRTVFTATFSDNVSVPIIKNGIGNNGSDAAHSSPHHRRLRRQSYVESRTCSSRFQLEIIAIPVSIMMIPVALCGLLLCVFCCGPKDSRGKMPENCFGVVGRRRNAVVHGKRESDDFEYGDGYVQRKDSKKTRFATDIQVFVDETSSMGTDSQHHQRMDSNSDGESLSSRRGSATTTAVSLPTEAEQQRRDGISTKTDDISPTAISFNMTAFREGTPSTLTTEEADMAEKKCAPKMKISNVSVNNSTTPASMDSSISNQSEHLQRTRF